MCLGDPHGRRRPRELNWRGKNGTPFWIGGGVWLSACGIQCLRIKLRLRRLAESSSLLLTPFERNIQLWRQLWRVLERSQLVVQIVDARNPLGFRCIDLENYVRELEGGKRSLLLINKADLLTEEQRYAVMLRRGSIY